MKRRSGLVEGRAGFRMLWRTPRTCDGSGRTVMTVSFRWKSRVSRHPESPKWVENCKTWKEVGDQRIGFDVELLVKSGKRASL